MDLTAWLLTNNLSETAFAGMVGCNQTTINRARRGVTMPEGALLARIVEATEGEVQANDLFAAFMNARAPSSTPTPAPAP